MTDEIEIFSLANERMTAFVLKQCCRANCLKFVTEHSSHQKDPATDSLDFSILSLCYQVAEQAVKSFDEFVGTCFFSGC